MITINITRKKIKHLRLVISSTERQVRVSAPMRMPDSIIQDFIAAKMPWIKKHLSGMVVSSPQEPIEPWQKQQLREAIAELVKKYESVMGVSVSEFRLKHMKTRWGTCNTRARRIWINTELARKSPECLEYIVVHEMVHLLERSHNARFKAFMDTFLPNWRQAKRELKLIG
ncbi:MAG: SprT family zinc-dependent metalloprotease [Gammaproteobacteria bacterium]|nr:SprT family zinc-dependent metalloprotease [Gammaproteobacteria bacterium]